jgi:hypothetical protein
MTDDHFCRLYSGVMDEKVVPVFILFVRARCLCAHAIDAGVESSFLN